MKTIDEQQLTEDAQARYDYLAEFIGFTPDDIRLIQGSAPHIGPRIPDLVDQTYRKLLSYDATARHFLVRQEGYDGDVAGRLADLSTEDPQIQFRKDHLNRYFVALIGRSYDAAMVRYLDMVGSIHTSKSGNSGIVVPLIQMNALLGLMSDLITETLISSPLDAETKLQTIRAFQKLLWIQNDFVNRHYSNDQA